MKFEKILRCFIADSSKLLVNRLKPRTNLTSIFRKLMTLSIIYRRLWKDLLIFHMFKNFKTSLSPNSNLSGHELMNFCKIMKKCENALSNLTRPFVRKHRNQSCWRWEKSWRNLSLVWAMLMALKLRLTVWLNQSKNKKSTSKKI